MSRWTVRKTRVLGDWEAYNVDNFKAEYFPTWRDAIDYVDQEARTREVVLPVLSKSGVQKIGDTPGLYSLHVDHRYPATHIYLGGFDGVVVESDDLAELATYLLAISHNNKEAT